MNKLALLFGMSENERKGFLVLSVLIVLMGITPIIYRFYAKRSAEDMLQLSSIVAEEYKTAEQKAPGAGSSAVKTHTKVREFEPFFFDPNNLPVEKWKALGFSEKQIQVIKNYESKGGRFRTKADVAKLYVISDENFNRIAPYITLPETVAGLPKAAAEPKEVKDRTDNIAGSRPLSVVDLSIADTVALKEIRGIGSVLASRIVRFRDALGGFHTVEQLKEVFGISEEQFLDMESRLVLSDNFIRKLPINKLSVEELIKHPYISRREATHLVRYREQHGSFETLADLEKMHALNRDFLRKIAPYLEFGVRNP